MSRKHCVFASPNLSWTWNKDNPLWIAGPVVDVIASLPLMDDFQLVIVAKAAIPLDRLSGLRNFVDRGPLPPEAIGSRAEVIGNGPQRLKSPCHHCPQFTNPLHVFQQDTASNIPTTSTRILDWTVLFTSIWLGRVSFAVVLLFTVFIPLSQC